jgi:hypothetical protein
MAIRFRDPDEELELFVEWVLRDLTSRPLSGKRQTKLMRGMWMTRQLVKTRSKPEPPNPKPRRPQMRGSDITERRYVAFKVLTDAGVSMKEAIIRVGAHLGMDTAEDLEIIRTGFYSFRSC